MKTLLIHGPYLLLMLAVTFLAFGFLLDTPLWNSTDASILCDAQGLGRDPDAMFNHIGFYFSQPLLQLAFLAEYRAFGIEPTGYLAVNLVVHAFNAFVVFMLVHMLFPRRGMALLAGLLFALTVGSYGKTLTAIHQLESLLLATFHLLVLYFFIRNDFRREGRVRSPLFALGLGLFLMAGLTKIASFSLIGTLIAYKVFFYKWRRGRAILSADLLVFTGVGILFYWAQHAWGYRQPTIFAGTGGFEHFTWISFKNIFRYLNLMFFPMQTSPILKTTQQWVIWMYEARTVIRVFLTLAIVSYSFFGFVFGSKAIRFFIAWTYISLLPFSGNTVGGAWLNLNHLYLASLGFCVILAAGVTGTSALLGARRWRRWLPYLLPAAFVAAALFVTHQMDRRHCAIARSPELAATRLELQQGCPSLRPAGGSDR